MPVTPLINGVNYSWANVGLVLFGVPVIGITKIDYENKQEKKNNYGAGIYPVSRGYGNVEPDGSIEVFYDEWRAIVSASPNFDPLQIGIFDIPITFGGSRLLAKTTILRSCEFMADKLNTSQGDSKILITIPLIIGAIENKN